MALLVSGLVCLFLGSISLFPLLRVSLMGLNVLDSAEDIAAFQKSGLYSGVSLAYTDARRLPGYLVLTQSKTNTLSISLPYMYVEAPTGIDKEYTFLNLYRLSGADYQVLLVSTRELTSPVYVSMEYSSFYSEWRDQYLDGGANRYVFAASASPLPFILFLCGLGGLLLGLLLFLYCFKPLWRATPFGRQLAKWGDPDDVERDLNSALSFPLFESGALLLSDRWLILGERKHPQHAPLLTKSDRILSAHLIPDKDDEIQLLLTFMNEKGAQQEWACWLSAEEASCIKSAWFPPCLLKETVNDACSCRL